MLLRNAIVPQPAPLGRTGPLSLGDSDRGLRADAGNCGVQPATARGVARTRVRDSKLRGDLSITAHFAGMRIAAGCVDRRGGPVPGVAPEPDRRRAVATDPPRLVEGASWRRYAALFCLSTRAGAAPAPAESFAAVPLEEQAMATRHCRSARRFQESCWAGAASRSDVRAESETRSTRTAGRSSSGCRKRACGGTLSGCEEHTARRLLWHVNWSNRRPSSPACRAASRVELQLGQALSPPLHRPARAVAAFVVAGPDAATPVVVPSRGCVVCGAASRCAPLGAGADRPPSRQLRRAHG